MATEQEQLEALLTNQEAGVRAAFRTFLSDTKSDWVVRRVRELVAQGDIEGALDIVNSYIVRLADVFPQMYMSAGAAAAESIRSQLPREIRVSVGFDPTYPRAASFMRLARLDFIQGFTQQQTQATRAALERALMTGAGPLGAAYAFRDSMGLTAYQQSIVDNYRRALETQSTDALTRDLRDRRYDNLVERVANGEIDPLNGQQIDRMVNRYRTNFLNMRADTIARTETQKVLNAARHEATTQAMEQAGIDPKDVTRTWRATLDDRTRDTHADMDGQERGLNEPFESPSGALLMTPGDSSLGAPAEEIINCRCVVTIDISSGSEEEAA